MFGLDPLSRPVAIAEIVLLLTFIALVGWLLGRLVRSGRARALRATIVSQEQELAECRRSKAMGVPASDGQQTAPAPEDLPAFVHADPLLPAISHDDTPELIAYESPENALDSHTADQSATGDSEVAVLSRIAARAEELNFDRIGRATAAESDDLKDIVGIGPFLERKLHSLGIYTFRQIANFTKEDSNKVNEIIEFFPGRIERDNWVGQAKQFHDRKYGAKS